MLIQVLYRNNRFDFIKTSRLEEFIETGKISAFKRRRGWVRIGVDPIRVTVQDTSFPGRDRRQPSGEMTAAV
jgi:hypothetical protein